MANRRYGQDGCAIAAALEAVGDRWTLLIVRDLMGGRRRFGQLRSSLPGLAPNLLTQRLKALVEAGLARREYFREIPPRVEYELTDRGRELRPVLLELLRWGLTHGAEPSDATARLERWLFALPLLCEPPAHLSGAIRLEAVDAGSWTVMLTAAGIRVARGEDCECQTVLRAPTDALQSVLQGDRGLLGTPGSPIVIGGDAQLAEAFGRLFEPRG